MKNTKEEITKAEKFVRAPIVTIMGHVDHGKTSLLDFIRSANVTAKEAGGITQSIGAYQADYHGKKIAFIDTPGHAAFTQMRARGGKAADIVVLVVAADDAVMPQTKEAISHIKASNVPMIVAINKMDMPGANPQKVKQQLAENSVMVEDWGGDVMVVELSAKTGEGVDKLLESISVLAELLELNADPEGDLEGIILESKLDPKKGPVFTAIVKNGTLNVGQTIYASGVSSKVKALMDYKSQQIKTAGPGTPVEILGFSVVPNVGDSFVDDKNKDLLEAEIQARMDEEAQVYKNNKGKVLTLILKADSQGTLEALEGSLRKLSNEDISVRVLHKGTGEISESDILLASTSKAIVVGFNSKLPSKAEELSDNLKVRVLTHNIIYELIDEIEKTLLNRVEEDAVKIKGRAMVIQVFPLPSGDIVAGCKVAAGVLKSNSRIAIYREGTMEPMYMGKVDQLKRGKDLVDVVGKDVECGVLLKPVFSDIKVGDRVEVL